MIQRILTSIASAFAISAVAAGAMAANIQVTTTAGVINTNDGLCSLPEAVKSANTLTNYGGCVRQGTASTDSIILGAGVYSTSQTLVVTRYTLVKGLGSTSTTISFSGGAQFVAATAVSTQLLYLYDLRVTSNRQTTCVLAESGAVQVRDVDLDACYVGLQVLPGARASALSSKFRNSVFGVAVGGDFVVNSSEVTNNTATGMLVYGASNNTTINDVYIAYNGHSGVAVSGGAHATIANAYVEYNLDNGTGGGGIRAQSQAQVVVNNSTIAFNESTGGGGGIYNVDSDVAINDSLIDSNYCYGSSCNGGGILTRGSSSSTSLGGRGVTLTDSTVSYNFAQGNGGGVAALVVNGTNLTVLRSTLAHNTASLNGGGLYSLAQLDVVASTISNNVAGKIGGANRRKGGGMYHQGSGELHLYESTIAKNDADEVGGLYVLSSGNPWVYSNIIANNTSTYGNHDLRVPSVAEAGTTLWGDHLLLTDFTNLNTAQFGILYNQDPKLSPLTMVNGHLVHLLGADSGAIDRVSSAPAAPEKRDQLKVLRPLNGNTGRTSLLDLGAVEYKPPTN